MKRNMKRIMKRQWFKKLVVTGFLALGLAVGSAATAVDSLAATKQCDTYDGDNSGDQDYSVWSTTVKSYLNVCDDGSLMRVQSGAVDEGLLVEYYDSSYNFKRKQIVSDGMLPIFGGFYAYGSYYYVISGQNNFDESDSVEVYRITKYDQSWNVVGYDGLYGANTYIPFDAGSARMTASGDYLLARTCHEMYMDDGYNHQANVTIEFNMNTAKITDSYTGVMNSKYGYVSHSFNQFIRTDGTSVVGVDHGDAHPRSVCLLKYNTDFTTGSFTPGYYTPCSGATMLPISGDTGANWTGASVGGFELSSSNYIVAGNTIDQSSQSNSTRNIFVSVVPRTLSSGATVRFLTNYAEGEDSVSTPHLVKLGDDLFMVMWTRENKVYYTEIDGNGIKQGNTYSMDGKLSDCVPVIYGGKLVWYVWEHEKVTFYSININNPSVNTSTEIVNGHDFDITYAKGSDNTAKQTCKVCGHSESFTTLTQIDSVWWRSNSDSGSYWCGYNSSYDVGDTLDLWIYNSSSADNNEFEVVLSDTSIATYTQTSNGFGRINMLKAGDLTVTIRVKYNPSVKKTYDIKVAHTYSDKITKEATCIDEGIKTRTCTGCGYVTTEKIAKTAHSYGSWKTTKEATYSDKGIKTRTCTVCGAAQKSSVAMKTLNKVSISSATNTSKGVKLKWAKVTGAKGYYVYRKTGSGKYTKLATISNGKTVSYLDKKATNGTAYTYKLVAYAGSNKSAAATIKAVYVSIPKLSAVSSKKAGAITASWKRNTKVTAYQLQYSTSSKFKGAKAVTIKGSKTLKTTISKLKKGKKYYVRIRAYKTVSGKKYYSAWGSKKAVTVRKK